MIPKLTDDAISRLPLQAGRAELLEEIMSTVAPDRQTDQPTPLRPRRRARWVAPIAAAAVVAGIAGSSLWWHGPAGGRGEKGPDAPAAGQEQRKGTAEQRAADPPTVASGHRAVLDVPGWQVRSTESEADGSLR